MIRVNWTITIRDKLPNIKIEDIGGELFVVSFEEDVRIMNQGATREEALRNFWDYVYDLIPLLERKEATLSPACQEQLEFLRKYFEFKDEVTPFPTGKTYVSSGVGWILVHLDEEDEDVEEKQTEES